ncbi:MAG TPA: NAD-dependent epimerase/dehydratase family protein [Polyangiales bacterium]|nr:NAD-dependent epimerase/dehydratase family protein [Polyangiales bacterium]
MNAEKGADALGLAAQGEGKLERRNAPGRGRVIAITGAMTFLGRSLVRMLAEADDVARVVVVDLENPDTAGPATTFYAVDLTQPGADARLAEILQAERIDTLVHLAFLEAPTPAVAWAHELESVGTMHVLRACHKHALRKLIVCSSFLVYGPHADNPNYLSEERPLRGLYGTPFVSDKIDVEQQVDRFRENHPRTAVTVLRLAALLGPSVRNHVVRWFSRTFVPTVLGYDPLLQFVHEVDALRALRLAIESDASGTYNIASSGVLPLSTVIRLSGGLSFPLPYWALRRLGGVMWGAQLCEAPPGFAALLRYLCVVDTTRARQHLGFSPDFSTRDAVLDFDAAKRARSSKLLSAVP